MIDLPEGIEIAKLSPRRVRDYWKSAEPYVERWLADGCRSFEWFERWLNPPRIVLDVENSKGLIILDDLVVGSRVSIHPIMFDHKLSKRMELLRDALVWCFFQFDLRRAEFLITEEAGGLRRFARKFGAKHEGVLRSYLMMRGEPMDVHVFSILREEVL